MNLMKKIHLKLSKEITGYENSPVIYYDIFLDDDRIGYIYFQSADDAAREIGNLGYFIEENYRGHHYAYEACLEFEDILKEKGISDVLVLVDKDNEASLKTVAMLNASKCSEDEQQIIFNWEIKK